MGKCEVCGRETITFRTTFGTTGIPSMDLCRTCNGRLLLSIPKGSSPEKVRDCIDKLFSDEEARKKLGTRRNYF